jgi:uncharacterized damage-inducible protein DinB
MKRNSREKLLRLADELAEEILNTPDEEILAEAKEEFGSAEVVAVHIRGILAKAQQQAAKQHLANARKAINQEARSGQRAAIQSLDAARARRDLKKILQDSSFEIPITLAARKETELSDSDVLTMLNDLHLLGLYDPSSEKDE